MDAGSNDANVISFERAASAAGNNQLDSAGETILQLIHRAAGFAEENSRHALQMAQAFSDKLRVAEERIAELEAEVDTQSGAGGSGRALAPSHLYRDSRPI